MTNSKWSLVQHFSPGVSFHIIFTAIILVSLFSATALGANLASKGSITIVNFVKIGEEKPLDFGIVQIPSRGYNHFLLNPASGRVTTSGPGDGSHMGGAIPARYQITGEPYKDVQVSASIESFDTAGVSVLQTSIDDSNSNSIIANLSGTGYITVKIGGLVSVSDQAVTGVHSTDVMVTAAYQ